MDAALHDVLGCVGVANGDGMEAVLAHHRALAEHRDIVGLARQAEQQIDGVHLDLDAIVVVSAGNVTLEGIAGLGAFARQGQVVALQLVEGERLAAHQ